jgi:hypothetical protein
MHTLRGTTPSQRVAGRRERSIVSLDGGSIRPAGRISNLHTDAPT